MSKKTPFFSHDMNARHDPRMVAMRSVYGAEGYGIFWALVEMMGESDGYALDMQKKYSYEAYAKEANCERNTIVSLIYDCINEFELFVSDGERFWSPSLLRRMEYRDMKSEKARESVGKRWSKNESDTNALPTLNDSNTNVLDTNYVGYTINKTKQNINKDIVPSGKFNPPSVEEVKQYCEERQNGIDAERLFHHYEANGWRQANGLPVKKWKSCVITWEKNERNNAKPKGPKQHVARMPDNFNPDTSNYEPLVEGLF